MCKIIAYTDDTHPRKRACINCGLRDLWGAGSRCGHDGHYIGYLYTWDDWCKHWTKDKRKPGEIDVDTETQSDKQNLKAALTVLKTFQFLFSTSSETLTFPRKEIDAFYKFSGRGIDSLEQMLINYGGET